LIDSTYLYFMNMVQSTQETSIEPHGTTYIIRENCETQACSERNALLWEPIPTKHPFLHCAIPSLEYNGAALAGTARQLTPDT